jgi:hypothetical protein
MQTINAFGQRLAFHRDRSGEFDGRVLIGARAPHLSVGHDSAPDFASAGKRAVVRNGDIGEADPLADHRALARFRQRRNGLRADGATGAGQRHGSVQQP